MTEKFNLSEKLTNITDYHIRTKVLFIADVKAFIKRLKENKYCHIKMQKEIDKLAGDRLI